jgi:cytochrome P450
MPPSPPGWFLFGHLFDARSNLLGLYERTVRECGDVATLNFGFRRIYFISHPDLIERVLTGKGFTKHYALRFNRMLLGDGLLTSEGEFWLKQRRLIQPPFLRQRVLEHAGVMAEIAAKYATKWRPGETHDIHKEMRELTMAIAAKTLFGADVGQREGAAVAEALVDVMAGFEDRLFSLFRLPEWFPTISNIRAWFAVRRLDNVLYDIIRSAHKDGPRGDLLSILQHARHEGDGTRMSEKQLRDEAMTLFLAGHETTALALTYTLYLLARHPQVAEELRAELKAVLDGKPPTVDDLPKLKFTEQVVLESMRLYPPAYAIGRQATAPCELGGYHLPEGGTVVMAQWVVHRDPRWWDEPNVFRPHRWTEQMHSKLHRFAYFPFGGGPRVCVGNTFAMVEMVLVLAVLASKWRFEYAGKGEIGFRPKMTLSPDGPVQMVLREALPM